MSELGFKMTPEKLQQLLDACLKPEEIAGPADVQLERVEELLHWFARYTQRRANPKWLASHACELAYYIATLASNRFIDLHAIKQKAFMEGVNTTDEERAMLKRLQAHAASAALPTEPQGPIPAGRPNEQNEVSARGFEEAGKP